LSNTEFLLTNSIDVASLNNSTLATSAEDELHQRQILPAALKAPEDILTVED